MTKQGVCSTCCQYRWLGGTGGQCKPCAYPVAVCLHCQGLRKIYVRGLCSMCYQHARVEEKISSLESGVAIKSIYNEKLFTLYLKYIRRYRLHYAHLKQTQKLVDLLTTTEIATIRSWKDIYRLNQQYFYPNTILKNNGSAFLKIGQMLEEVGLLPPKELDLSEQVESLLNKIPCHVRNPVEAFLKLFKSSNPSESTQRGMLQIVADFFKWWGDEPIPSIDHKHMEYFFNELKSKNLSHSFIRKYKLYLNKFFKYCLLQKMILTNPCQKIEVPRSAQQLTVCSEDQIKKLTCYIKNPKSHPESALLLSLVLFFGLRLEDLTLASLSFEGQQMKLVLKRKTLTKGRRYYNRHQILDLPTKPVWFLQLQKRFYANWQAHYRRVRKSFPQHPLLLPYNNRSNSVLNTDTVSERIKIATTLAIKTPVTAKVLRQTCGHIYSRNQDASLLTQLGWSPQFAFHYTWLPRRYFSKN